jgi:hypothetical protein
MPNTLVETFDSGTPDNTWTGTGGTFTSGYSTTKIWQASNSLLNIGAKRYASFTAADEYYAACVVNITGTGTGSNLLFGMHDGTNSQGYIQLTNWSIDHWTSANLYFSGGNTTFNFNFYKNTIYWVMVRIRKVGSSTGTMQVWITSIQPTTAVGWGTAVYSNATLTISGQPSRVLSEGSTDMIMDEIRVNVEMIYYDDPASGLSIPVILNYYNNLLSGGQQR